MTVSVADTLIPLVEAIDAVAAARSLDEIQGLAASAGRHITGADGATFAVRDGDRCRYVAQDAMKPLWKGRSFPLDSCIAGWAMLHGEAVVVEDVYADTRILHAAYRRTFVKSLLVVPVRTQGLTGAIGIYWAEPHSATGEETALIRVLASSTAVALERATLKQEVERRRVAEEDLRELSERDPLTGVLNRRAWDQLLASALRKGTQPLYVALLDLDHFKGYNDCHGHPAGDDLLRRAARAWRSAVRAGDVLARYGGEEFAVLLAGCDEDRAIEIAERLRRAMIDEQHVSIGVARWDGRESAVSLIARADHALYDAKRNGRNRVTFAT